MADKTYKIQATLSNGGTIETGTFVVPQGPAGESAGFGTPTVSTTTGNPGTSASVTVTANTSSPNTAKVFDFEFTIPRGADGQDGSVASLNSNNTTTRQTMVAGVSLNTTSKALTVTEFTGTVGSSNTPIYMTVGVPTAMSATVGSATRHMYMRAGSFTNSSSNVGNASTPIYMSGGVFTECTSISIDDGTL